MRHELTVDADYLAGGRWDAAAGVREFMQNARDEAIEHNAPLEVSHRVNADGKGVLVIENEGAVLPIETLLLGRSTKRDRQSELAGKWGEGYKLGSLALLRAGYEVKIRNGGEVWVPSIEPSEKYGGRKVLVFTVSTGRAERNRVQVEITGVSAEDWKSLREHYLFLYKREIKQIETEHGDLLLGPKFRGRVYVKDILVMHDEGLDYGYNLKDAELDRDRKMIGEYDLQSQLHRIWSAAVSTAPAALFNEYYALLKKDGKEVRGLNAYTDHLLSPEVSALVAEQYKADFGADAVPVRSMADSKDVEHLGARGIVTGNALASALSRTIGDMDTVKRRLNEEVTKTFSWPDLDPLERFHLERAIALVNAAAPVSLADVDIVTFRSPTLHGQFKDGRVLLARKMLSSRRDSLAVMVHEVAHRKGNDGDKQHVAEIERIWAEIVEGLV